MKNVISLANKTAKSVVATTVAFEKAVTTAQANIAKTASELKSLAETSVELTNEIEFKTSELDAIEVKIIESERKSKADLSLRVLENEDTVLKQLLDKRKLANITIEALKLTQSELETSRRSVESAVASAVESAKSRLILEAQTATTVAKSKHEVEIAQKDADIKAFITQVSNLNETISGLKEIISAERDARVSVAEANRPLAPVVQAAR